METIDLLAAGIMSTICSRDRLSQASVRYKHSQALTILHWCLQSLLLITIHQNYVQSLAARIHADCTHCMPRMTSSECMYDIMPFCSSFIMLLKVMWKAAFVISFIN